jgi:transaldolase
VGFVTIQDDPRCDDDAEHIVEVTMRCTALGPNFMTKIPVIASGIAAIEDLVARNIPICATEIFAVAQATHMCEVYERAARKSGKRPPFYVTHITGIFDQYLAEVVKGEKIAIAPEILAQAGCLIARKQYRILKERGYPGTLLGGGARGIQHFTEFVGGDFHITINWSTAAELLATNPPVVSRIDVPTPKEIVEELWAKLPGFRRAYDEDGLAVEEFADFGPLMFFKTMFLNGYARLLDEVVERRARIGA